MEGKAFVVRKGNDSNLVSQFFWLSRGDEWIVELDEKYSYAVISTSVRKHCLILSRAPAMKSYVLGMLIGAFGPMGPISLAFSTPATVHCKRRRFHDDHAG
ncbi:hypothetical protein D4R75_05095 [bacterium]|nr:MAG: hypothetical protein D4R75_05095 [bacterium]